LTAVVRDNFMLFVDGPQGKLFQMALNGTTVVELSSAARKPQNPVAVDYDPLTRWIYWTDIETHTIRRTRLPADDNNSSSNSSSSSPNRRPDGVIASTGSKADDDQVFLQLTPGRSRSRSWWCSLMICSDVRSLNQSISSCVRRRYNKYSPSSTHTHS